MLVLWGKAGKSEQNSNIIASNREKIKKITEKQYYTCNGYYKNEF